MDAIMVLKTGVM